MSKLQDLLAKKAELDRLIEDTRRQEQADAVSQVRSLMAQYGLTLADISGSGRARPAASSQRGSSGQRVAPKYRDEAGNTWSGRGLQPKWLRAALADGRKLQDFAI